MKTKWYAKLLMAISVMALIAGLAAGCAGETTTVTQTRTTTQTQVSTQTVTKTVGAGETLTVTATAPAPTVTQTVPGPTATVTSTVTKTVGTTGEPKVFKLQSVMWFAATSSVGIAVNRMLDMVEERSGGRIQFPNRLWGGELGATADGAMDALSRDTVDVAYVSATAITPKKMLSVAAFQPGVQSNAWAGLKAYAEWSKLGPIAEEWAEYNTIPVWPAVFPPNTLITKFPANSIDDLKGKVMFGLAGSAEVLKNIGAAPAYITPPEIYDALSKGTLEGVAYAIDYSAGVWKWHEVAPYWISNANLGGMNYSVAWNLKTFNSLPEDLQSLIIQMGREDVPDIIYGEAVVKTLPRLLNEILPRANVTEIKWSEADMTKFREVGIGPVQGKWITDREAEGRPEARWLLKAWDDINNYFETVYPAKVVEMDWPSLPY